jgi:hypothetical protein
MDIRPKIFRYVRFNSYLTQFQKELLGGLAESEGCSKTEIVRKAVHKYLREQGIDDGLIADSEEIIERLKEEGFFCGEES